MLFVFLGTLVVALLGLKKRDCDYMSFDSTLSVKGVFVVFVFLRHFRTYPVVLPAYENLFLTIDNHLGQLIVAMFLFYSGYGVFESIKRKGIEYVNTLPKKRIAKVLIQFDIAVLLFLVVGLVLGESFPIKRILLSFLAWEDLNNSNWFIFAILCCYLFTYLCFTFFPQKLAIYGVMFLCLIYVILVAPLKSMCWWDTIICFPVGMLFSNYKNEFERAVQDKGRYAISLACLMSLFLISNHFVNSWTLFLAPLKSILFCMVLTLVLFKIPINNPILRWLGDYVFPIYILQRLSMIVFQYMGLDQFYEIYLLCCIESTLLIAVAYRFAVDKLKFLWT